MLAAEELLVFRIMARTVFLAGLMKSVMSFTITK